jgi:D-inositol-3-phosphate glycosyltransferase
LKISLLTGGSDRPYAFGLLEALISRGVTLDFIGSNEFGMEEIFADERVNFINLRGDTNPATPVVQKMVRICKFYIRLVRYAAKANSEVFHILWENRFPLLDRIILNVYYKLLGKKLVFTAHTDLNTR